MDTPFSTRLKDAIAAKGMTQEGLAREVDVTLRAVQFWCAGDKEPRGRQLVALARALDRDPAWFFDEPERTAA